MSRVTSLRRHDGFTLVELLVAMTLGLVVIGGAFSLISVSEGASKRVGDRVDAQQRGRSALDQIQQGMRAMTCLPRPSATQDATPPVAAASATELIWFANLDSAAGGVLADENGDGDPTYDPDKRRLRFVTSGARTQLVLERWTGTPPTFATAAPTRTIASDLSPVMDGGVARPFLTYLGLQADGSYVPLTAAEVAASPGRVVRVDIAFRSHPSAASRFTANAVDMTSSVYARTVNRDASPPVFGCPQ